MTNAGTASTDYNLRVHERQTLNCLGKSSLGTEFVSRNRENLWKLNRFFNFNRNV